MSRPDSHSASQETRELVARSAKGDRAAFRRLYDLHAPKVHAHVGRLVGWGAAADDVTQEVFIQVFQSLPSFKGDSEFTTWLHRLTRNVAISYLRRRAPAPVELADYRVLAGPDHGAPADLDARRQLAALHAALSDLTPEAREAFIAFEVDGLPLATIAADAGEPLHTVASRIRRARERLREVLERLGRGWRKAQ